MIRNRLTNTYRWQGEDNTFFHKSQIKINTKLINFGRLYHGDIYQVISIKTMTPNGYKKVQEVLKLSDEITLRHLNTNRTFPMIFSNLSYSAIWRLL